MLLVLVLICVTVQIKSNPCWLHYRLPTWGWLWAQFEGEKSHFSPLTHHFFWTGLLHYLSSSPACWLHKLPSNSVAYVLI